MSKDCIDCLKRKLGCHSSCDSYIEYRKEREKKYNDNLINKFETKDYLSSKLWRERKK
mgnify:CR=1 FL=1